MIVFEILFLKYSLIELIFIIFIGLYRGSATGSSVGFFMGLADGVFSTTAFGVSSFSYAITGYLAGRIPRRIDEENPLAQISIVFFGVIAAKTIGIIIEMIFTGNRSMFYIWWTAIFVVLAPMFFWIFKKWWIYWFRKLEVDRSKEASDF